VCTLVKHSSISSTTSTAGIRAVFSNLLAESLRGRLSCKHPLLGEVKAESPKTVPDYVLSTLKDMTGSMVAYWASRKCKCGAAKCPVKLHAVMLKGV
jgi:hypothetical protein